MIADPAVALRSRHPWESIDLGALMLKRWAGIVAALVLPPALAAAIAVALLPEEGRIIAIAAIWWLKPLFGRLAVVPVGVLLFSPRSKPREIAAPLLRSLGVGLLADLSWRRFSPWRAYLLAARTFEGTRGSTRRRRCRELLADSRGWIAALAAIFACVEWSVAFATSVQLGAVLDGATLAIGKSGYSAILGISYALAVALVEPLFALSCFSLYLNRRTVAEGWDLELRFKRLAARQGTQKLLTAVLLLGLASGWQGFCAEPIGAQAAPGFSARVESVLEDPVFGKEPRTVRRLTLRDELFPERQKSEEEGGFPNLFGKLSSETLRIVVVAAVLVLVIVVLAANWRNIGALASFPAGRKRAPAAGGIGLEAPAREPELAESLRAAAELWREGDKRAALALSYRAAIGHGTGRLAWRLGDDSTEGDCLREARRTGGDFAHAFSSLASAWSRLAWGGMAPSDEEFRSMLGSISLAAGVGR